MRRALAVLVLIAALAGGASAVASSDPGAARHAARWIAGQPPSGGDGQAADAIIDLRATGLLTPAGARTRAAALRVGARRYVTSAGSAAKAILGLTAAGVGNPRCAGSFDLLAALNGRLRDGIYGTTAFDDGLALLALHGLHEPIPRAAVTTLLRARHGGGWTLALTSSAPDDVESTGLVIEGLRAAGVSAHDRALRAAVAWIHTQRVASGGYALDRGAGSDGDTTGIALAAENAMGAGDPRAVRALIALQRPSGAVQYTASDPGSPLLATLDATLGLSGHVPPVGALPSAPAGC